MKTSPPKKRPRRVAVAKLQQDAAQTVQGLAARAAAGKCPMCGSRPGTMEITIGPVFVKICEPCSRPVWHLAGIVEWMRGRKS